MSKAVYLSERGEDKNDRLSLEKAVLTGKRAVAIALKEKTRGFHVNGNAAYVRRMNAELEAGKVIDVTPPQKK